MKNQPAKSNQRLHVVYEPQLKAKTTRKETSEFTIGTPQVESKPNQILENESKPKSRINTWLDNGNLRKAQLLLRAVNHTLRQQLIELLHENDAMSVTQLLIKMRLDQSVISQHLAVLRRAGIVMTEKRGKYRYYSINLKRIEEISNLTTKIVG